MMMRHARRLALLACGTLLTAHVAPAMAQDAVSRAEDDTVPIIVVTARKVSENIQSIPVAVSAFSDETIRQANIVTAKDFQFVTPSLYANQSAVDNTNIIFQIRGISSTSSFGESSVATYIDNVYRQLQFGLNGSLFDLQRVEVLKGAQGTLYGKNASAGVVNIITRKPNVNEFGGYARATYGTYAQAQSDNRSAAQVEGAINVPLVPGTLALRVAGSFDYSAGFGHDRVGRHLNDRENPSVRAHLLLDTGNDWSFLLSADYSKFKSNGQAYIVAEAAAGPLSTAIGIAGGFISLADALPVLTRTGPPGPSFAPGTAAALALMRADITDGNFYSVNGDTRFNNLHTEGASLTIDGMIGSDVNVRSITAFRHLNRKSANDLDGTAIEQFHSSTSDDADFGSQELNLYGKIGRLDWQTGLFYSFFQDERGGVPGIGNRTLTALTGSVTLFNNLSKTNSFGVFGRASYHVTDQLTLTGGLRYSEDKRKIRPGDKTLSLDATQIVRCPTAAFGGTLANNCLAPFLHHNDDGLSYEASAGYQATPDILVYGATRRGYRAGDFNTTGLYNAYDPEFVTDYELGLKSSWFDRRMVLNVAAYYSDYSDIQRTAVVVLPNGSTGSETTNAAKAVIKGFEFEAMIRPGGGFQFGVNYSYTEPRYKKFLEPTATPGVFRDRSKEVFEVPRHNIGVNTQVTADLGAGNQLTARVDGFYRSKVIFGAISPLLVSEQILKQDGYFLMNGRIAYKIDNSGVEVGVFARNLLAKKYYVGATSLRAVGTSFRTPGEPRFIGADLMIRFGGG